MMIVSRFVGRILLVNLIKIVVRVLQTTLKQSLIFYIFNTYFVVVGGETKEQFHMFPCLCIQQEVREKWFDGEFIVALPFTNWWEIFLYMFLINEILRSPFLDSISISFCSCWIEMAAKTIRDMNYLWSFFLHHFQLPVDRKNGIKMILVNTHFSWSNSLS